MQQNNRLSKIAVIGDVHAEDMRLATILSFLATQELDRVYCVGDIADGIGSVDRCCALLAASDVSTVMGNHDEWCLDDSNRSVAQVTRLSGLTDESRKYLASLPLTIGIETVAGKGMICHGLGEYNMASVRPTDTLADIFNNLELRALHRDTALRFIINGHSHRPDIHEFGHLVVINAGSLEEYSMACLAIVDFAGKAVDFYRVDESAQIVRCETKHWTVK